MSESECICPWTDPTSWFTYYGAIEPGGQREWDPSCTVHPGDTTGTPVEGSPPIEDMSGWALCPECSNATPVLEEAEEQDGFEEKARRVWVKYLACGHQEVTDL